MSTNVRGMMGALNVAAAMMGSFVAPMLQMREQAAERSKTRQWASPKANSQYHGTTDWQARLRHRGGTCGERERARNLKKGLLGLFKAPGVSVTRANGYDGRYHND